MKTAFTAFNVIDRKKKGFIHTREEIEFMITGMMKGSVADYQMTAWLMAIYLKGLNAQETAALTQAMLVSGKVLSVPNSATIDKHSTGGVGDKTSLILAPIAAAAGIHVPMIAGRGLGHTGGTIDKIEAINGFKTNLNLEEFSQILKNDRLVLIGQTEEIAPADKKIYALRDVTATIDHIGLITASIMSKKIAEGAHGYVFDIKTGNGAFMKGKKDAILLAKSMIKIAQSFKRKAVAYITDMNQPLGTHIGHSLELIESFEILKGKGDARLSMLSLELAAAMIHMGGKAPSLKAARNIAVEQIKNGQALQEFEKLIERQGGDPKVVHDYSRLPVAEQILVVKAKQNGILQNFATEDLGRSLIFLGGGRLTKDSVIDHSVGYVVHKFIGDKIKKNDPLISIYHHRSQKDKAQEIAETIQKKMININPKKVKSIPVIYDIL